MNVDDWLMEQISHIVFQVMSPHYTKFAHQWCYDFLRWRLALENIDPVYNVFLSASGGGGTKVNTNVEFWML